MSHKSGILAFALLLLVALAMVGCFGPWFDRPVTPTLYLGELAVTDGQGHLLISAANMPDGGLAAIHVEFGGLLYNQDKVSNIAVEDLNGFVVLVSQFADGEGGFLLVNPSGVESGPILRLAFDARGNVKYGDVQLLADHIDLVSDALSLIENWNTPAYFAK